MRKKREEFRIVLFLISFLISMSTYSQFKVDAGKDTTFCTGQNIDSLFIGTTAKIENGIPPYSIQWECNIPKGLDAYYTASDLLSDTTILTPYFLYNPNHVEWIKFILHVTDSENNYSKDSIFIRFSNFVYSTGGGQTRFYIEKGDSILLNFSDVGIGGGISPLTYHWQPKTYLSNPDSVITWCKPDSSILYEVVAIDSFGCVSERVLVYDIRVLPETTENKPEFLETDKTWVFLLAGDYPNPEIYADLCYKISNDTIIGEVGYKKLLFSEGCDKYKGIRGFIRETEEGKVYFMENKLQMENEFLLYDFGMQAGDSAQMGWENSFYRIDSIKLNSDGKKLFYVSKSNGNKDIWIEGVGSEMGLLRDIITGGSMMFSCCFVNEEQLYHNPDFADCFFEGNAKISITDTLNRWNIGLNCVSEEPIDPYNRWSTYFEHIEGDTIINEMHYKRLVHCLDSMCVNKSFKSFIREDSGKVFLADKTREFILYDFNLKQGDSLVMYYLWDERNSNPLFIQVDSVKSVIFQDQTERIIQHVTVYAYHYRESSFKDVLVEGIGSMRFGLEFPISLFVTGTTGCYPNLLCFYTDKNLVYTNPEFNDCYITTGISQFHEKPELVKVFSAPNGMLVLELTSSVSGTIFIFNMLGEIVSQKKILDSTSQLYMPGTGIYLYRFVSDDGQIQSGKTFIQ